MVLFVSNTGNWIKGAKLLYVFWEGRENVVLLHWEFSRRVLSASVEFLSIMLGSGYSGSLGACSGWVLIFDSGYSGASGSFTRWMNDLLWGILGSSNPYLWMCCEMCLHPNGGSGCSWSLSLWITIVGTGSWNCVLSWPWKLLGWLLVESRIVDNVARMKYFGIEMGGMTWIVSADCWRWDVVCLLFPFCLHGCCWKK